jgi:hypothetical protein
MIKKITIGAIGFYLLIGTAAQAQLNVELNLGEPVYVASPTPAYISPYPAYYDPHHRNHDYSYWRAKHREHEHHDNGRHEGWDRHEEHDHR